MSDEEQTPLDSTLALPLDPPPASPLPGPALAPESAAAVIPPPPVAVRPPDEGVPDPQWDEAAAQFAAVTTTPPTHQPPQPHQPLGTEWTFGASGPRTVQMPKPRKSVALAIVVVLVVAAGSFLFLNHSKSGGGTAFALAFAKGQTYRYHMDMSFIGSVSLGDQRHPVNMQIGEDFTWKVESVDANGVATVTMTVEDMTGTINGEVEPADGPVSVEIRVAKDGRILTAGNLAVAGGSSSSEAFPGTDQFLPLLPDHPVKPGDAWDKVFDQDFPFGGGKIHYVSHNTYQRDEAVDGVQAAVISSSVHIPLDLTIDPGKVTESLGQPADPTIPKGAKILFTGTENLTMTAWLDLAGHTLLKAAIGGSMDISVELKGVPAPADLPGGKVSFSGKVSLQVQEIPATTSPAASQATTSNADKAAQSDLRNAVVAAKVYFVDHSSYSDLSPKGLKAIEPSLAYNASATATKAAVSVRDVSKNVVLLVTRSDSGNIFCLVDDAQKGTFYGTQDAKEAADCSGGW